MKSWKTTLGGLLTAAGSYFTFASMKGMGPAWFGTYGPLMAILGPIINGVSGRDNNVPSEAVPSATAAAEKIKGDTAPPFAKP